MSDEEAVGRAVADAERLSKEFSSWLLAQYGKTPKELVADGGAEHIQEVLTRFRTECLGAAKEINWSLHLESYGKTNLPNDILIRIAKTDDGMFSREVFIAVNDESLVPEMKRTADYIGKCLEILGKSDAEIEYSQAIQYAEGLAGVKPRIIVAH